MGKSKTIGDKTYVQDANGDWYEAESPVQQEPLTTKVINGVQYHKDANGDWYEGEVVKKKETTGHPSKAGVQTDESGIPTVSLSPSPLQKTSQSSEEPSQPSYNEKSWAANPLNPMSAVKTTAQQPQQTPIKGIKDFGIDLKDFYSSQKSDKTYIPKPVDLVEQKRLSELHKQKVERAIDNTTAKALRLKGIKAPVNSPAYIEQKKKVQKAVDDGDATYQMGKDGEPGLNRTIGFWDSLAKGWNESINGNKEADDFVNNMTTEQRVEFANRKQKERSEDEYIGELPGALGSVGQLIGENAQFLGKAALGTAAGAGLVMAAPETAGASLEGLPAVVAFAATAPDMVYQGGMQETLRRYNILKKENPEKSEEELMSQAEEGMKVGEAAGGITNMLLMGTAGNNPISKEGKDVVGSFVSNALKSATHMGTVSAGVEAGKEGIGAAQGIKTTPSEVIENTINSFKDNATVGLALHGVISAVTGLTKVPKAVNSAFKYALKDQNPVEIQNILQANEQQGKIPPGTSQAVMTDLANYNEALGKTTDGLTPEAQASVAGLMQKRNDLQKEMSTKDFTQLQSYQDRIDALNKQIEGITKTNNPFAFEVDDVTGKPLDGNISEAPVVKENNVGEHIEVSPLPEQKKEGEQAYRVDYRDEQGNPAHKYFNNEEESKVFFQEQPTGVEGYYEKLPKGEAVEIIKTQKNDKENITGVPSEVGVGKEPIQAQPVEGGGAQEISSSGVLQAQGIEGEGKGVEGKVGEIEGGNAGVGKDVTKAVNDKMRQTSLEMEFKGQGANLSFKNNDIEIGVSQPYGSNKWHVDVSDKADTSTGYLANEAKSKVFDTKLEALDYAKEQKEQSLKEQSKAEFPKQAEVGEEVKEEIPSDFGEAKVDKREDGTYVPYLEVKVADATVIQAIKGEKKKFNTQEEAQKVANEELLKEWNKSKKQKPSEPTREEASGAVQATTGVPKQQGAKEGVQPSAEPISGRGAETTTAVLKEEAEVPKRNKDNQTEFTTSTGRQKVNRVGDELIVTDTKTGEKVSRKTYKKAVDEYVDNFDFTHGEEGDSQSMEPKRAIEEIVESSNNPHQLAIIYAEQDIPFEIKDMTKDDMIADYGIGGIDKDSYRRFGDINKLSRKMLSNYIAKKGEAAMSLDTLAKSMSDHYFPDGNGTEITPQDLVDFMEKYESKKQLMDKKNPLLSLIEDKFQKLTGIKLTREVARKAINQQVEKISQEEQNLLKQDYESAKQLEDNYWRDYKATDGFAKEAPTTETPQAREEVKGAEKPTGAAEGGKPPVPPTTESKIVPEEDPQMTKMANAINDAYIEGKFGEDALNSILGKLGDTNIKEIYTKVRDKIKNGTINLKEVRERLITTKQGTEYDQAALLYDLAELKGKEDAIQKEIINETNKDRIIQLQNQLMDVQNQMMDNALANRNIGRSASTIFRLRQVFVNREADLSSMMQQYKASKGLKDLTPEQEKTVKQAYNTIREAKEKLKNSKEKLDNAITENERLKAENEKLKELKEKAASYKKQDRSKKVSETIARSNERIQKSKDALRRLRGDMNVGVNPKVAIEISKIAAEKVYQGVVKFDELVKNVYDDISEVFPDWTEKDVAAHLLPDFDVNKYYEGKVDLSKSNDIVKERLAEYKSLQSEYAKKMFEWQKDRRSDIMDKRPFKEKMIDKILRWQRFAVLSYPSTFVKLAAVVGHQLTLKPLKFLMQKGISAISPESIKSKQMLWGDPTASALGKYYSELIRNFSLANLREQFSGIDTKEILHGKGMYFDEWAASNSLLEIPGRSHGYIKSFIKNPEFAYAHEQLTSRYIAKMHEIENKLKEKGLSDEKREELENEYKSYDLTDDANIDKVNKLSLEHAKWSILMEDNKFIEKFRQWTENNGIAGTLIKTELPIVKIPVNFVGRVFAIKYGLIRAITGKGRWETTSKGEVKQGHYPGVVELIKNGTKGLTPEQADLLGKTLSLGTMGASFFLLGYLNRKNIKKNDDGSYEINGTHISKNFVHSPELESLFSGAETGNSYDEKGEKGSMEWVKSMLESDYDIASKNPFANMLKYGALPNLAGILFKKEGGDKKIDQTADVIGKKISDMAIPGFAKQFAQWTDTGEKGIHPMNEPIQRKPEGSNLERIWQNIEMGLPVLRENVPIKSIPKSDIKEVPELKLLIENKIEIPDVGNRETYTVKADAKHPKGKMTEDEYKKFVSLVRDYSVEKYKKTISSQRRNIRELEGMIKKGIDNPKDEAELTELRKHIQNKIKAAHSEAIKKAKSKLKLN